MMDGNNENDTRDNEGKSAERAWGAKNALKSNAGLRVISDTDNESTPLLGNGSGSSSNENGNLGELQWEGLADFEGLSWWKKPSVYWLLPPFFLFALAFGGILVPKLNLIKSLICREYFIEQSSLNPSLILTPILLGDDNPQCEIPAVQKLAARFTLYLTVIAGILSAVMSPKLGAISDRQGRVKVLVVTSIGGFLTEIITILCATYPESIHYKWLLAGSIFDGLCGSFTTGMALTHAYAADCTAPPKRAVAFGYFHACLFCGIGFGPLAAAIILRHNGTLVTMFYIALAIHIFFMLFILCVAPESLSKKRQKRAQEKWAAEEAESGNMGYSWAWAFKQINILAPLKILWPTGPGTSGPLRANLILLSAIDTIIFGVAMGSTTVVVYYLGYQFLWKTARTSEFVSTVNIFRVSGLLVILPLLNYLVRTRRANRQRRESGFAIPQPNSGSDNLDLYVVRVAILFEILGYCGYAAVRTGGLFTVAGVLAALGGIGSPTLQSALTKHVPHDRVGQLLGATGLLHALARVVAPIVFNVIYAQTVATFPQAVFVALGGCFVIAFVFSWFVRPHIYLVDPETITANSERVPPGNNPDVLVDEEIAGA